MQNLIHIHLSPELIDRVNTALYWQGAQTGALWALVVAGLIYSTIRRS
jgi:hypothetical protein